jgi:hypothetical protein
LWIFTDKPEQFETKLKYSFLVKVRGNIRKGHGIEQVDLISAEAAKTDQPSTDVSGARTN